MGKLTCTTQKELLSFNTCGRRIRAFCVCELRYKWEMNLHHQLHMVMDFLAGR